MVFSVLDIDRGCGLWIHEKAHEGTVSFLCNYSPVQFRNSDTSRSSSWSPGKNSMNTVHVDDVAAAVWALAGWMAGVGRTEANTIAGEDIQTNDKSKVKDVEGVPDLSLKLVAPLFNIVRVLAYCFDHIFNQVFDRSMIRVQRCFPSETKSPDCLARRLVSMISLRLPWSGCVLET